VRSTNGFIYRVERIAPYCTLLEPMLRQAQAGQFVIVSSELVVLERLVKPLREGDTVLEQLFTCAAPCLGSTVDPRHAIFVGARSASTCPYGLKTPDALHAATDLDAASTLCITNDRDFRRVEGLPVVVLEDLLR